MNWKKRKGTSLKEKVNYIIVLILIMMKTAIIVAAFVIKETALKYVGI